MNFEGPVHDLRELQGDHAVAAIAPYPNVEPLPADYYEPDAEYANYIKDKYLGRGSFGETFLVHHRDRPHVRLVMKTPRGPAFSHARELLRSEAAILQHLHNYHIVRFRDFFDPPGADLAFILLDYAEGGNLADFIARRRATGQRLSIAENARIVYGMLQALLHIHDRRVLHLDIK